MTQHNNNTPFISKRPRYSNKQQKLIDLSLAEKITLIFFTVYFGGHVLLWAIINLIKGQ